MITYLKTIKKTLDFERICVYTYEMIINISDRTKKNKIFLKYVSENFIELNTDIFAGSESSSFKSGCFIIH